QRCRSPSVPGPHHLLASGESTNRWILPLQEVSDPGWAIRAQDRLRAERTGAPIEMGNCDAGRPYVIRSLKDLRSCAKENANAYSRQLMPHSEGINGRKTVQLSRLTGQVVTSTSLSRKPCQRGAEAETGTSARISASRRSG